MVKFKSKIVFRGKENLKVIKVTPIGKDIGGPSFFKIKKGRSIRFSKQIAAPFKTKSKALMALKTAEKPRARKPKAAGQFASIFVGGTRRVR